jgi:hypothetical protein
VQNDGWRVAHNAGGGQNGQAAAPNPGQVKEMKEIVGQFEIRIHNRLYKFNKLA